MKRSLVVVAIASLLASSASAACPAPASFDALLAHMASAEDALHQGDDAAAIGAGQSLEQGLPCLGEVIAPAVAARVYRAIGSGHLLAGDEGKARQWFNTAIEVDPALGWGVEDQPANQEIREAFADVKLATLPAAEVLEGVELGKGRHFLDGRPLTAPAAVVARPHLYQLDDGAVRSWLIRGNAFPDEVLHAPGDAPVARASREREESCRRTSTGQRLRKDCVSAYPAGKDPLITGGVVGLLGAGALYGYSGVTRERFDAAGTPEDVERYTSSTNQFVMLSGGVLAAGVATFVIGMQW